MSKRHRENGHLKERSPGHWAIVISVRNPATGNRKRQWHSFTGTKKEAQAERIKLLAAINAGTAIEPTKVTVANFVRARVDQWEAAGDITAKTAQRYRQLIENQMAPHLGAKPLQKLSRLDVEAWHTVLRNGGLAARTIRQAHRVLGKALSEAERDTLVAKNVCRQQRAPKVAHSEMTIVQDVPGFVDKLRGSRLYILATVALFTGMRLGEILALRWSRIDLDRGVIEVREALEETKAFGVRFKAPKSKAGRRDVTLPDILVDVLREHRKATLELRLQLGLGKLPPDALLFANLEGQPQRPSNVSSDWGDFAQRIGIPEITFHALRHTHASQLIAQGVDIVTISQRLGHAKPNITLATYAHMFHTDDSKAAAAINAALSGRVG
jgi:integrase